MQFPQSAAPGAGAALLRQLLDAALPAARDRAALLAEVREALAKGDEAAAIPLMRRYCGLPAVEIVT